VVIMASTPRIDFDHLPADLQERLGPRVRRLGYLGEFFQVAAHQPAPLAAFVDFTEALKAALAPRLVEIVALTVAAATGNVYERVQHERLALKLGMPRDEVRAVLAGRLPANRFSATERAAAALARDVVAANGRGCSGAYSVLEALAGPALAVGSLMTAARYLAHATMANTWALAAPVESPLTQGGVDA
jgi:alkylhydroperoxidase family enzyme